MGGEIKLARSITVRTVAPLQQQLIAALETADTLVLDASALDEADLSFLQLVDAARVHAEGLGKSVRLAAPANAALTTLLERAGFLAGLKAADTNFWFHGDLPQ